MIRVLILFSTMFLILNLLQCSAAQNPEPERIACKAGCDTIFDNCVKKAVKNEAKKAACKAVKIRCYNDCNK